VLKATIHRLGRWYLGQILESEAESQKARAINERPIELAFLFQALSDLRPARVLDVGPGTSPLPAVLHGCGCHVTAIDNISDYWPRGMFNRYWHVIDEDIRTTEPCSTQWLAEAPPARIVRQDYWQFWSGDVWRQGHRLTHSIRTAADRPHQLTCALIRRT